MKLVVVIVIILVKGLMMEIIIINIDVSIIVEVKFIVFRIKFNGNLFFGFNLIWLFILEWIFFFKCFVIDFLVLFFNLIVILFKVKIE